MADPEKIYNQPIHKLTWMVDWAMDSGATLFSLSEQVWWIELWIVEQLRSLSVNKYGGLI
jgi:hypothetical protein